MSGIPEVFYTDHGTDFTSVHLSQVGANLRMQLVYTPVGRPRGRGKIERFFQSVEQLLLEQLPGYARDQKLGRREFGKQERRRKRGF